MTHKILNRNPKGVILEAFRLLDDDETGNISFTNLKLISDLDVDSSGTVGFEEFFKMMTHQILDRGPTDEVLKAFCLLDDDETGKISLKNLKLISDLDDEGSGTSGFEDFFKMITRRILNRDPVDEIQKAFRLLDDHVTRNTSFKNLKLISDVNDEGSGTFGSELFFKMITYKILNRDPKHEILNCIVNDLSGQACVHCRTAATAAPTCGASQVKGPACCS